MPIEPKDREHKRRAGRLGGVATAARHPDRGYTRAGTQALLDKFPTDAEKSAYFRELARAGREKRHDPATHQRLADIGRLLLAAFERTETGEGDE